jgi:hypothetical protein
MVFRGCKVYISASKDPDSMTLDLLGNIVLDSQGDQELIIVSNPWPHQPSSVCR